MKGRKNHPDVASELATLFFQCSPPASLGQKSVIISQTVKTQVVLSRMLSIKPGTLDKRLWLRAQAVYPSLALETGRKLSGNRTAPHLSGAQPTTVATTALQATELWHIRVTWLQACMFPHLCSMFCHGKTMEMPSNLVSISSNARP